MSDNDRPEVASRLAESRAQILRAASSVFLDAGFERSSIDQVAAAARMSKQSIYDQFPSKIALFEAAVRSELEAGQSNIDTIEPTGDREETLLAYGLRLFDGFADPTNFGLFRANIVAANHLPELADELHEHRLGLSRTLADYLDALIRDGVLADVDPLSASIRFGGLSVEGSRYFLGMPLPRQEDRATLVARALDLFLHGYARQADAHGPAIDALLDQAAPPVIDSGVALRLSAEKLQKLIDAAMAEFQEHGYSGANVDRIAAATHISKATIYRQFGNKEGLFRHVIEGEIYASSLCDFECDTGEELDEAVTKLARQVLDWHLQPSNIRMHRLLVQGSALVPDLARRFHDMRVAVVGRALDRLLSAHGWPRPDEAAARSFYLLATFAVRFLTVRQPPGPVQRDLHSRETARLFLHGLSVEQAWRISEGTIS
ncbi:TetR/AcrR family transcriptional regulator [Sphingobium sp.]|uniref:TetR/AcrR family transcriptional regulator n=1 Tax=Sphingobium sp. TaxID=1912891 RepID=UPI0028BF1096|nr:TetR/AcrR family transcriptional regulator [Sphingobium sp.]